MIPKIDEDAISLYNVNTTCLPGNSKGNLPPISLICVFSNQNAGGNVSKISVNHTDDIPYKEMFRFTANEVPS